MKACGFLLVDEFWLFLQDGAIKHRSASKQVVRMRYILI